MGQLHFISVIITESVPNLRRVNTQDFSNVSFVLHEVSLLW
jgi:hypothetical protein